jgi:hypothetical protein
MCSHKDGPRASFPEKTMSLAPMVSRASVLVQLIADVAGYEDIGAFWKYFSNPELVEKHGKKGRENILTQ